MRCSTMHGGYRCDRDEGHKGECETAKGPRPRGPVSDLDAPTALIAATKRIELLERTLSEIYSAPCDAKGEDGASCACCLFDKLMAAELLFPSATPSQPSAA